MHTSTITSQIYTYTIYTLKNLVMYTLRIKVHVCAWKNMFIAIKEYQKEKKKPTTPHIKAQTTTQHTHNNIEHIQTKKRGRTLGAQP